MTRGHQCDFDCLRAILRLPRAYAGMMGSRRRTVIMRQQLLQEGIPEEDLNELRAPIGLPIGSQTPARADRSADRITDAGGDRSFDSGRNYCT